MSRRRERSKKEFFLAVGFLSRTNSGDTSKHMTSVRAVVHNVGTPRVFLYTYTLSTARHSYVRLSQHVTCMRCMCADAETKKIPHVQS